MGDLPTVDLRQAIVNEANSQGVPAGIALAVAARETGIMQWRADGSLVIGADGEIGIFQLMPSTAEQLGVDATDPLQNIQGGVAYLAQMYSKFGSWPLAIAAYNWGPAKVSRQLAASPNPLTAICNFPVSVRNYVSFVLGSGVIAQCAMAIASAPTMAAPAVNMPPTASSTQPSSAAPALSSGAVVATAAIGAFGILWALFD